MKANTIQFKPHLIGLGFSILTCLSVGIFPGNSQVIVNPNTLTGTVRFNNSNPAILSLLEAPGEEGFTNLIVRANSVPPAPAITADSGNLPVTNRVVAGYELTVDSGNPGFAYAVTPIAILALDKQSYYFLTATSAPVEIGGPPPVLDFEECVGVMTVRFVTEVGDPVTINGGRILALDLPSLNQSGDRYEIAAGSTEQHIFLRGGQAHQLEITVHRGTDFYTDRIQHFIRTNVTVTCDQFDTVDVVIPSVDTLGRITGTLDILGEFEAVAESNASELYPHYSSVIANNGPFGNQRWDVLPGVNFTTSSSGAYTLSNVVPSSLDPASVGYAIYAQTLLRSNREVQVFITPGLGWGANPPVVVAPGAELDLSNTFVIEPAFMAGQVRLKGPAESLGRPSLLRGIQHASDDDLDLDGLPDAVGTYGIYGSSIAAEGIDRLAGGATFTASRGYSYGDFDGAFNPTSSEFEGDYELVVGGLNSEPSIWKRRHLSLTLYSGVVTNDDEYYFNQYSVTQLDTNDVEFAATETKTADVNYCFSEVLVRFRAASGTFWSPRILTSSGTFHGTNFLGETADYVVNLSNASGQPDTQADATNEGVVVMYLPEGTYTLHPAVTPGDSALGTTGLQPIDITVGCGQRIAVEPCLQLILNAPSCSATALVPISGAVASCTNSVTNISYTLDGGPAQVICNDCGPNPVFVFNLNLPVECAEYTLIVTARDDNGGTSSITTVLRHDATPPQITCPADITVGCAETNGLVVSFNVTATDNCLGPVTIISVPASGSLFPLGETVVNSVAIDACGNTNACSFKVTVGTGTQLSIERAVIVRWSCGTLESANDLGGPWADVPGATSPYSTPASEAQRFYRTRN